VDYKALSNAGTWMIGRLQTDQDKQRLLDGLESAAGGIKRSEFDRLISSLGKRVFLYHNVHEKKPSIFHTRWVMNYLAGPLTISQIPDLNALAGAQPYVPGSSTKAKKDAKTTHSRLADKPMSSKPSLPSTIQEYFCSAKTSSGKRKYTPALVAVAEVRYLRQRPPVEFTREISAIAENPLETGQMWEDTILHDLDTDKLLTSPQSDARFTAIPEFMKKSSWWSAQEKEFEHWIYETDTVSVRFSKALGVSAGPEVSEEDFRAHCKQAAAEKLGEAVDKVKRKFKSKQTTLENRIERQVLKVDKYKNNLTSRSLDTVLKVGESLLNLATKRKLTGLSSSSTKVRMAAEAKTRLKEAETVLENYQEDMKTLREDLNDQKLELRHKWENAVDDITEVKISPTKQNIRISHFGIVWRN